MAIDPGKTVGELAKERLGRTRVFERFDIDYCCHGKVPLRSACANRGLDLNKVVAELEQSDSADTFEDTTDYGAMALGALVDHIVSTHHDYLREELPRLDGLLVRVVNAHGPRHPEVIKAREVFGGLRSEMESHTMKEERVLFPLIKKLEQASSQPSAGGQDGSVTSPIKTMEHEHDSAGVALAQLRTLTNNYEPPQDACPTFRALLHGLSDLESDLHWHIHKENNILFPRAIAIEESLEARTPSLVKN